MRSGKCHSANCHAVKKETLPLKSKRKGKNPKNMGQAAGKNKDLIPNTLQKLSKTNNVDKQKTNDLDKNNTSNYDSKEICTRSKSISPIKFQKPLVLEALDKAAKKQNSASLNTSPKKLICDKSKSDCKTAKKQKSTSPNTSPKRLICDKNKPGCKKSKNYLQSPVDKEKFNVDDLKKSKANKKACKSYSKLKINCNSPSKANSSCRENIKISASKNINQQTSNNESDSKESQASAESPLRSFPVGGKGGKLSAFKIRNRVKMLKIKSSKNVKNSQKNKKSIIKTNNSSTEIDLNSSDNQGPPAISLNGESESNVSNKLFKSKRKLINKRKTDQGGESSCDNNEDIKNKFKKRKLLKEIEEKIDKVSPKMVSEPTMTNSNYIYCSETSKISLVDNFQSDSINNLKESHKILPSNKVEIYCENETKNISFSAENHNLELFDYYDNNLANVSKPCFDMSFDFLAVSDPDMNNYLQNELQYEQSFNDSYPEVIDSTSCELKNLKFDSILSCDQEGDSDRFIIPVEMPGIQAAFNNFKTYTNSLTKQTRNIEPLNCIVLANNNVNSCKIKSILFRENANEKMLSESTDGSHSSIRSDSPCEQLNLLTDKNISKSCTFPDINAEFNSNDSNYGTASGAIENTLLHERAMDANIDQFISKSPPKKKKRKICMWNGRKKRKCKVLKKKFVSVSEQNILPDESSTANLIELSSINKKQLSIVKSPIINKKFEDCKYSTDSQTLFNNIIGFNDSKQSKDPESVFNLNLNENADVNELCSQTLINSLNLNQTVPQYNAKLLSGEKTIDILNNFMPDIFNGSLDFEKDIFENLEGFTDLCNKANTKRPKISESLTCFNDAFSRESLDILPSCINLQEASTSKSNQNVELNDENTSKVAKLPDIIDSQTRLLMPHTSPIPDGMFSNNNISSICENMLNIVSKSPCENMLNTVSKSPHENIVNTVDKSLTCDIMLSYNSESSISENMLSNNSISSTHDTLLSTVGIEITNQNTHSQNRSYQIQNQCDLSTISDAELSLAVNSVQTICDQETQSCEFSLNQENRYCPFKYDEQLLVDTSLIMNENFMADKERQGSSFCEKQLVPFQRILRTEKPTDLIEEIELNKELVLSKHMPKTEKSADLIEEIELNEELVPSKCMQETEKPADLIEKIEVNKELFPFEHMPETEKPADLIEKIEINKELVPFEHMPETEKVADLIEEIELDSEFFFQNRQIHSTGKNIKITFNALKDISIDLNLKKLSIKGVNLIRNLEEKSDLDDNSETSRCLDIKIMTDGKHINRKIILSSESETLNNNSDISLIEEEEKRKNCFNVNELNKNCSIEGKLLMDEKKENFAFDDTLETTMYTEKLKPNESTEVEGGKGKCNSNKCKTLSKNYNSIKSSSQCKKKDILILSPKPVDKENSNFPFTELSENSNIKCKRSKKISSKQLSESDVLKYHCEKVSQPKKKLSVEKSSVRKDISVQSISKSEKITESSTNYLKSNKEFDSSKDKSKASESKVEAQNDHLITNNLSENEILKYHLEKVSQPKKKKKLCMEKSSIRKESSVQSVSKSDKITDSSTKYHKSNKGFEFSKGKSKASDSIVEVQNDNLITYNLSENEILKYHLEKVSQPKTQFSVEKSPIRKESTAQSISKLDKITDLKAMYHKSNEEFNFSKDNSIDSYSIVEAQNDSYEKNSSEIINNNNRFESSIIISPNKKSFKIPKAPINNFSTIEKSIAELSSPIKREIIENLEQFETMDDDVLILDYEAESEIDVESVKDFSFVENNEKKNPNFSMNRNIKQNISSAFKDYWSEPALLSEDSSIKKKSQCDISSAENELSVKQKNVEYSCERNKVYLRQTLFEDSDTDCDEQSFKRKKPFLQLERPSTLTSCQRLRTGENKIYTMTDMVISSSNCDTFGKDFSCNINDRTLTENHNFAVDLNPGFLPNQRHTADEISTNGENECSQVFSESGDSIHNILNKIKINCENMNLDEALVMAKKFISISSVSIKRIIIKELFMNIVKYLKNPHTYYESENCERILCAINEIILDHDLLESELGSLLIIEYVQLENIFLAETLLTVCKKKNIVIKPEVVSNYAVYLNSYEMCISKLLFFLEYVKYVCNNPLPRQLLIRTLELSIHDPQIFSIPVSEEFKKLCNFLCFINSDEIEHNHLRKFIQRCIQNEHWNKIADFFRAWMKKTKLSHCLYMSLAIPIEDCASCFEKFAAAVHGDINDELPMHHASLFGQMGVLILMEAFSKKHFKPALEILHTLHHYQINYFELQVPAFYMNNPDAIAQELSNPLETYVFQHKVAFTAIEICLYFSRAKDAFNIFKNFDLLHPNAIKYKELKIFVASKRFIYLLKLSKALIDVDTLDDGIEVMRHLLNAAADKTYSLEDLGACVKDLENVYNRGLTNILNQQQIQPAYEFYSFCEHSLKGVLLLKPDVFRGLVVSLSQNEMVNEAKELFIAGVEKNIYFIKKPEVDDVIYFLTILSSWTEHEIKLCIEVYVNMMFPVFVLKIGKTEIKGYTVKITFEEDENNYFDIDCLEESSKQVDVALKKTCNVLKNLDSEITWIEEETEKCLIVQAVAFYNVWKKCSNSDGSAPIFSKLPSLCIEDDESKSSKTDSDTSQNDDKLQSIKASSTNEQPPRPFFQSDKICDNKIVLSGIDSSPKSSLSSNSFTNPQFILSRNSSRINKVKKAINLYVPYSLNSEKTFDSTSEEISPNHYCSLDTKKLICSSKNRNLNSDCENSPLTLSNFDTESTVSNSSSAILHNFEQDSVDNESKQTSCSEIDDSNTIKTILKPPFKKVVVTDRLSDNSVKKTVLYSYVKSSRNGSKTKKCRFSNEKTTKHSTSKETILISERKEDHRHGNKQSDLEKNSSSTSIFPTTKFQATSPTKSGIQRSSKSLEVHSSQQFYEEEFTKITHFLGTKIRLKHRDLTPEGQNERVITLTKLFIKENGLHNKLDKKGMKLLWEFSDKHI